MNLFSPFNLRSFKLNHRVVMAPLTRMRADNDSGIPSPLASTYYAQRATEGGLLIAEATQISQQAKGYPRTPGIHTSDQITEWHKITDAVKKQGAIFFLQLWHVGRISHSSHHENNALPVAPSAIRPNGNAFTRTGERVPFETPHALELNEISQIVADYRKAAENAKQAGFHGVEVHAGNGYLLQQFLEDKTNHRNDQYGGSIENRARLLFEVIEAVCEVWPSECVGVRLAPFNDVGDMADSNPQKLYSYVIERLAELDLCYLHLIEPQSRSGLVDEKNHTAPQSVAKLFRPLFSGPLIISGGFTAESAEHVISDGLADLVAFGRAFIANPDLPNRLRLGASLNTPDKSTFYGGDEHGYIDYPTIEQLGQSND